MTLSFIFKLIFPSDSAGCKFLFISNNICSIVSFVTGQEE